MGAHGAFGRNFIRFYKFINALFRREKFDSDNLTVSCRHWENKCSSKPKQYTKTRNEYRILIVRLSERNFNTKRDIICSMSIRKTRWCHLR